MPIGNCVASLLSLLLGVKVYNTKGLSSAEAERLLGIHGLNELPEKKIPK